MDRHASQRRSKAARADRPRDPVLAPAAVRRVGLVGIGAAVVLHFALSLIWAASVPYLGSADEGLHLDYAAAIWEADLPTFQDGPRIQVERSLPPVQFVAHHPPLFYTLLAPVVGPALERGEWRLATGLGRLVNVGVGATVVAMVGAAVLDCWRGRRRQEVAVASAVAVATFLPLVGASGAVYNDPLAAAGSVGALWAACRILHEGATVRRACVLTLACLIAMAARLNTVAVALPALLAPLAAAWTAGHLAGRRRALAVGTAATSLAGVAILLGIGWFYLRNVQLTGSLTGGHPDWAAENLGRRPRTLLGALGSRQLRVSVLSAYWFGRLQPLATVVSAVVVPAAIITWIRRRRLLDRANVVAILGAAVVLLLVLAELVLHHMSGGATNPRYLLPAILPLGLVLAVGLLAVGRHWGWVTVGLFATAGLGAAAITLTNPAGGRADILGALGALPGLLIASEANGWPPWLVILLAAAAVSGVLVAVMAIRRLRLGAHDTGNGIGLHTRLPSDAWKTNQWEGTTTSARSTS